FLVLVMQFLRRHLILVISSSPFRGWWRRCICKHRRLRLSRLRIAMLVQRIIREPRNRIVVMGKPCWIGFAGWGLRPLRGRVTLMWLKDGFVLLRRFFEPSDVLRRRRWNLLFSLFRMM